MKKGICVKQKDITDCGAACLASIGIHYRLRMPVTAIRQLAGTDRRGTNVMGMIAAAEKMNFTARGVKGNIQSLRNIPLPAIAHLVLANKLHHYVVIYEVKKSSVVYMDPGDGRLIKKSFTDFQAEWSGVLVIITPAATFTKGSYTVSNYRRFWQLAKPQSGVLLQAITGSVFYTILGLSTSVFVQKIVDNVLRDNNLNLLNLMSVIMIVLMVFQFLIGILRSVFALQTGLQIDSKLIPGYYAHIMNMPQKFFDSMRVGEIISRVNDAVKIRSFVNEVALGMIVNVLIIVFSFGLMFMYYWKLALIVALVIPCYTGIYLIGNRIARRQQRALMEKGAALETQLVESLDVAGLVKRFNLELFSQVRTESRFGALLSEIYRAGKSSILLSGVSDLCTKLFTIALLWCGGYFVINRELSPGELLSFYALAGYLTTPAMALIGSNRSVQDALIAAERLYEITDLDPENDIPDAITFNKLPGGNMGNITFENVHFSYGTRATVLKGLNLEISAGSSTAITGRSGSGK
ncbi:MAG: ABC transporter transmembrane domain-containing protein [Flavitalea sp.]